jgi:hypothetical protein
MPKRESAFFKAMQEQQKEAGEQGTTASQDSETVSPSNFSPVPPLNSSTGRPLSLPTVEQSHSAQEAPSSQGSNTLLHRKTVSPQPRQTVSPAHRSTVTAELNKTSFYLTQAQLDKLDELAYAYKRQTGKRINRNDIVRFLVDHARLETLLAEW